MSAGTDGIKTYQCKGFELRACPFCGGEPYLYVGLANGITCRVKCESCGIMTEIGRTEVINDWNRRVRE